MQFVLRFDGLVTSQGPGAGSGASNHTVNIKPGLALYK